jgi:hypothetical protein
MEGFSEAMMKEWKYYRAVMIFPRGSHREFHVNTNVTKTLRGNDEKRLESKLSEHKRQITERQQRGTQLQKGVLVRPFPTTFW